jgi:peptidoglycan/xylan/chitin deacetylase (PgdA/CDA1 family)
VAEPLLDPQLLCVSPGRFAEQLDAIASLTDVVSLRDVTLRPGSVVITFDDGYVDNLTQAAPLLAARGMTASVFVAVGYAGRETWWDQVERLVLRSAVLPASLSLEIGGTRRSWALEASEPAKALWNVLDADSPSDRHMLYRELFSMLRPLAEVERARVMAELTAWSATTDTVEVGPRVMSRDEIAQAAAGGVLEVGAHTCSHPVLSALGNAEQRAEIVGSKRLLEEMTGGSVTAFAYPFGSRADYTAATADLVREAGFEQACANVAGLVRRRTDAFELPRFLVRDWPADELERRLTEWLRG